MLPELKNQINDVRHGSLDSLPEEYGHALKALLVIGEDASRDEDPEVQKSRMHDKAIKLVEKYGVRILDFLRPDLRALIQPEDLVK